MRVSILGLAALLAAQAAWADTNSYTGNLVLPVDVFTVTVIMPVDGTMDLQTWGFGGGTNAANQVIPAGGFDSFVGVFAGTGPTATYIDGASDSLTSFPYGIGCPPAGTVNIGGGAVCGDITLAESLTAGTYTVLLSDALYLPAAVFENNGELGDEFVDFTPDDVTFQTCNTVGNNQTCVDDTANYALDIITPDASPIVPEPGGLWALGLLLFLCTPQARRRLASSFPFKLKI
ncbi:MAG: DVUA0089 family protein [Terracidiphilus sp.]|jgi:hypothetical protein